MDFKIIDVVSNLIFPFFDHFLSYKVFTYFSNQDGNTQFRVPPPPAPPHPLPHDESPEKGTKFKIRELHSKRKICYTSCTCSPKSVTIKTRPSAKPFL